MKKRILCLAALLVLSAASVRADVVLGTTNSPGNPLTMSPGSISAAMLLNVVSDNSPNDVMAAWNVSLTILPDSGTSGTLTFQEPTSTTPSDPVNYVFGTSGLGILATNLGKQLDANDFIDPAVGGVAVPGGVGANLLSMSFSASADAAGLFGIYAIEGAASTQWSDPNANTIYFSNVPDGTNLVRIGEVLVVQAVPEPSGLILFGAAGLTLAGLNWRRARGR